MYLEEAKDTPPQNGCGSRDSSVSIVSDYGLDYYAIEG
jgi:hypothetical protein